MTTPPLDVEHAVKDRYTRAAEERIEELCCPVSYDPRWLEVIPQEIIDRDYGCGDPTRHLRPGETVLDLGSGGGKACYIAAQIVGSGGRVIGVDANEEMLRLAESHREAIGNRLGYHNVTFHRGRIQDLRPMIPDRTVDVIVSNCVLNLVRTAEKADLFREMHRVLRPGGRAVISDIVCDGDVPAELQADPELWSGCISGAFRQDRFVAAFEEAGFFEARIIERAERPWRTVEGIDFRSVTVEAFRDEQGASRERASDDGCCSPRGGCC